MYEQFYGLRARPFSILPDANFLYRSRGHRVALSLLEYGLGSQTGFTVITGEIGSGKTTLVQYLLKNTDLVHTIGYITNTAELNNDLMKWVLFAFDLETSGVDQVEAYRRFMAFVRAKFEECRGCVLIIDEAQLLNPSTLESIRLLSNVNVGSDHVLKVLLVGQPELLKTLGRPDLVQFAQRVSANFHLKALGLIETREYIRARLSVAGGIDTLFDESACDLIFAVSGGVPRQINILCDTTLVYGYADGRLRIDLDLVVGVLKDRSAGQSLGTLKIPPNFDRAVAEEMIRAARAEELTKGVEDAPPPDAAHLQARAASQEVASVEPAFAAPAGLHEKKPPLRIAPRGYFLDAVNGSDAGQRVSNDQLRLTLDHPPRQDWEVRGTSTPRKDPGPARGSFQNTRAFQIYDVEDEPEQASSGKRTRHDPGDQEPGRPKKPADGAIRRFLWLALLVVLIVGAVIIGSRNFILA